MIIIHTNGLLLALLIGINGYLQEAELPSLQMVASYFKGAVFLYASIMDFCLSKHVFCFLGYLGMLSNNYMI